MPQPKPDRKLAVKTLNRVWDDVRREDFEQSTSSVVGDATRSRVDRILSAGRVSFSYCLPTQLLGKLADHELDALCLQRGDDSPSKWDPRSFAKEVIVPWVRDNENVLGGKSDDPYVSNPLRQPRVLASPPNVLPKTLPLWADLHAILTDVQERDDPQYTAAVFGEVLSQVHDRLRQQSFSYPVLPRVSLEQTVFLVGKLVAASREGEHSMSLMAALLTVAGHRFGLWDRVLRQSSTTTDSASGLVADLECRKGNEVVFAVEVKERPVGVSDVRTFEGKLSDTRLQEALLTAPGMLQKDAENVGRRTQLMWSRGINLYHLPLTDLVRVVMSLVGETGRAEFIGEVGRQLDEYARPWSRSAWRDLLNRVLDGDLSD